MPKLLFPDITFKIRKRSYELYNKLGPLFSEEIFENGLSLALKAEGLKVDAQSNFQIVYKEITIGNLFTDLIVEDKIILELKKIPEILPINKAQIISYLKATEKLLGILINFGGTSLEVENFPNYFIKYNSQRLQLNKQKASIKINKEFIYPELVKSILEVVFEVYSELGPGFVHYVYRRAIWQEFVLRNMPFSLEKEISAKYLNQYLGTRKVRLFIVDEKVLLVAIAVNSIYDLYKQRLKKYLQYFNLKLGLIVNSGNVKLEYCFVVNK